MSVLADLIFYFKNIIDVIVSIVKGFFGLLDDASNIAE